MANTVFEQNSGSITNFTMTGSDASLSTKSTQQVVDLEAAVGGSKASGGLLTLPQDRQKKNLLKTCVEEGCNASLNSLGSDEDDIGDLTKTDPGMRLLRFLANMTLICAAGIVSSLVWYYAKQAESHEFVRRYGDQSAHVRHALMLELQNKMASMDSFSIAVQSHAAAMARDDAAVAAAAATAMEEEDKGNHHGGDSFNHSSSSSNTTTASISCLWPNITIPQFAFRATSTLITARATGIALLPLVSSENRRSYEEYVSQNLEWREEGLEFQRQFPSVHLQSGGGGHHGHGGGHRSLQLQQQHPPAHHDPKHQDTLGGDGMIDASERIFVVQDEKVVFVEETSDPGPYFPLSQHFPNHPGFPWINYDIHSNGADAADLDVLVSSQSVVLGRFFDLAHADHGHNYPSVNEHFAEFGPNTKVHEAHAHYDGHRHRQAARRRTTRILQDDTTSMEMDQDLMGHHHHSESDHGSQTGDTTHHGTGNHSAYTNHTGHLGSDTASSTSGHDEMDRGSDTSSNGHGMDHKEGGGGHHGPGTPGTGHNSDTSSVGHGMDHSLDHEVGGGHGGHQGTHGPHSTGQPALTLWYPVFNSFDSNRTVVAALGATIKWDSFFLSNLPPNPNGIMIVIHNPCDQVFTFMIEGHSVIYLGAQDHHESKYDPFLVSIPLEAPTSAFTKINLNTDYCPWTVDVYPSTQMEMAFYTDTPMYFGVCVACIFLFSVIVFLLYDYSAGRRRSHLVDLATEKQKKVSQANERLADQARRQLDHFAVMSHEMRTPLNCIVGLSSLLLEFQDESEEMSPFVADNLKMINTSADLLNVVVDDVLDYTKMESGSVAVSMRMVDVQDTIRCVLLGLASKFADKEVNINVKFGATLPQNFETDPRRLQQILYNLLSNACKFSKVGGTVDFTILMEEGPHEDKLVKIMVKDYGKGIDRESFETIFQPFNKESRKTQEIYGGTGLGLSITKNLVRRLGGCITVDSIVGRFTEFLVELPFKGSPVDIERMKFQLQGTKVVFYTNGELKPGPFSTDAQETYDMDLVTVSSWDEVDQVISSGQNQQLVLVVPLEAFVENRFAMLSRCHGECSLITYGEGKTTCAPPSVSADHWEFIDVLFPSVALKVVVACANNGGPRTPIKALLQSVAADGKSDPPLFSSLDDPSNPKAEDKPLFRFPPARSTLTKKVENKPTLTPAFSVPVTMANEVDVDTLIDLRAKQLSSSTSSNPADEGDRQQVNSMFSLKPSRTADTSEGQHVNSLFSEMSSKPAETSDADDLFGRLNEAIAREQEQKASPMFSLAPQPLWQQSQPQPLTPQQSQPQPLTKPKQSSKRKVKVLYAEDNKVNQKIMSRMLTRLGAINHDIVGDGKQALDATAETKYDLVFMDIEMPVMDGLEATRLIKERDGEKSIIVFCTGHALEDFRKKADEVGCDGFVAKPFSLKTIRDVLDKYEPEPSTMQ